MENAKKKIIKLKTKKVKAIGFTSIILGAITLFSIKFELVDKDIFHDIALVLIVGGILFIDPFYIIYQKLNKSKKN